MENKNIKRKSNYRNRQHNGIDSERVVRLTEPIPVSRNDKVEMVDTLRFPNSLKVKHLRRLPEEIYKEEESDSVKPTLFIPFLADIFNISDEAIEELNVADLKTIMDKVRIVFKDFF